MSAEFEVVLALQTALGRVGKPEEVARMSASLLSGGGGWINAQTIEVAGGYVIRDRHPAALTAQRPAPPPGLPAGP